MTVAYDGGALLGWQKTAMGPSVEESVQVALETILQEPITLQAASRTDAGVHASGQVLNFYTTRESLDFSVLRHRMNRLLSDDIAVLTITEMPLAFHPTLDCLQKVYHYRVCYGQVLLPNERHVTWHYPRILDITAMASAASLLSGTHDFSAFTNKQPGDVRHNFVRTVSEISIDSRTDDRLTLAISGTAFLYKMVRNIVGTLVYVGCGRLAVDDIPNILSGRQRSLAGITAPAHGLTLHRVDYA